MTFVNAAGKAVSERLLGTTWWNNGKVAVRAKECPPGFVKGRLPRPSEWNEKIGRAQRGVGLK